MSNLACAHETARPALAGARAPRPHRLRLTVPRVLAAGIAAAAAACQFDPSGQLGGGGTPPDAMVVPVDADPDQPDANCADWPFPPKHFEPCGLGKPVPAQRPLILDLDGVYDYNTDTGLLTYPGGAPVTDPPIATDERGVQTIWAAGVDIDVGTTLRVEGTRPLMIVSTADLRVRGIIDVSSTWDATTKTFDEGAGAGPSDCSSDAPQVGGECTHGGGGGGGGGFSGNGGTGGEGGSGRACGERTGAPGGTGGQRVTPPPPKIRGGCAGARGGNGDAAGLYGVGGAGGGAVHLVSMTRIDIEGSIRAGGAAGAGAEDRRSGGGGGGSGGFIGLEAPTIEIDREAILAANGGGGGGGTENGEAMSGQDGQPTVDPARGGTGQGNGGDGGDGSAAGILDGQPGQNEERGGGGGGGGAGYIVVYQDDPTVTSGAIISPAHTRQ